MTTASQLLSKVGIDTSDLLPQLSSAQQAIAGGIGTAAETAQSSVNQLGQQFTVLTAQEARAEQAAIATAQAHARALAAQGDRAGGAAVLRNALEEGVNTDQRLTYQVQAQIAALENGSGAAQQFGQSFQQGLLGIVGPAAVATAALGAIVQVGQSFKDAFAFEAELTANTRAIQIQLNGVRDSGQAFNEAQHYADTYKLTQQQTTEAMLAAVPVIRNTHASLEDVLGVFDRLQIRQPGKTFQDAARAIGELEAGQYTSLNKIFNVPLEDAHKLSEEIKDGGDAIQLVSQYLTDSGLGMDALKSKTEGATGALKDYARAQETWTRAQGEFAKGPGIAILNEMSTVLTGLTRLTGGEGGLAESLRQLGGEWQQSLAYGDAFNAAMRENKSYADAVAAGNAAAASAGNEFNAVSEKGSKSIQEVVTANHDLVDVSKLSETELQKLQNALLSTGQRASDAYTKLAQAAADYQTKGQQAALDHADRLREIESALSTRLQELDTQTNERRATLSADRRTRVEGIAQALADRLDGIDRNQQQAASDRAQQSADKIQALAEQTARSLVDARTAATQRLIQIEQQAQDAATARAAAQADQQAQYQQRLADLESQSLSQRTDQQAQYQQRVADLAERGADLIIAAEERAGRRASDLARTMARQAQDAADRAEDQAEDRQRAAEDRASAHADRLAALAARASGSTSGSVGHITTLSGGRFTTEVAGSAGGGSDIAAQIASENASYAAQQAAIERSQALADSRARRDAEKARERAAEDRALQEQDARDQLARQQATLAAQQQQLDAAYATQQAKAAQSTANQIALLDRQYRAQQAAAEAQAAKEAETRARSIADVRQSLLAKEADIRASSERSLADLDRTNAREAAQRARAAAQERADAEAKAAQQTQDANTQYAKQLVALIKAHTDQATAAETAAQKQALAENASYARQERDRENAYAKQKTQLETALGEQLTAYTKAQEDIGRITHTEAERREKIIADSYLRQAQAQRQAFDLAFQDLTSGQPNGGDRSYDAVEDVRNRRSAEITSSLSIGQIVLPGVTNPDQFLQELRPAIIRAVQANGGDVSRFFGGSG